MSPRDVVAMAAARAQARDLPLRLVLDDDRRVGPFRVLERLSGRPAIDGCTVAARVVPWDDQDAEPQDVHLGTVKAARVGGPR